MANIPVEEYKSTEYINAKIQAICSLTAIEALIISLQDNPTKDQITKNCLKKVYNLDKMPKEKGSSAIFCNPDTYTYANLNILFGGKKPYDTKDAKWWLKFWNKNQNNLIWNDEKGVYELKK